MDTDTTRETVVVTGKLTLTVDVGYVGLTFGLINLFRRVKVVSQSMVIVISCCLNSRLCCF